MPDIIHEGNVKASSLRVEKLEQLNVNGGQVKTAQAISSRKLFSYSFKLSIKEFKTFSSEPRWEKWRLTYKILNFYYGFKSENDTR